MQQKQTAELASQLRRATATNAPLAWFSLMIVTVIVAVALLAPWVAPRSPDLSDLRQTLRPPVWMSGGSTNHFLGTDNLGRDVVSRLIYGARISLLVGTLGGAVAGTCGIIAGLLAGYFRGWADRLLMRAAEVSLALPVILIALVMAIVLGPGLPSVLAIITLIYWGRFARQVRGEVLSVKEREYVTAAMVMGASPLHTILRHVLPSVVDSAIVLFTLVVGQVIVLEATLSFLGAGIPPPAPSWGNMIAGGLAILQAGWWVSVFPGLAMLFLVLAINLLGDWIRDELDPRLTRR